MSVDYRDTVFLPKTDFPMRAGLAKREPEILARWEAMDLFARQRELAQGREKFVLHDGPPYANGHLHMGHALNKVLKDVVNRSQQMLGKDANYVPGWDCHGLPIEWKVEESYRTRGADKDAVDKVEFRRECRAFAEKWIDIQIEEFQAPGGDRRLAAPLRHHGLRRRGADRARDRQVPDERRPLRRRPPGALVGGREDRPGRRRGGVPRAQVDHGLGPASRWSTGRTKLKGPQRG